MFCDFLCARRLCSSLLEEPRQKTYQRFEVSPVCPRDDMGQMSDMRKRVVLPLPGLSFGLHPNTMA